MNHYDTNGWRYIHEEFSSKKENGSKSWKNALRHKEHLQNVYIGFYYCVCVKVY